MRMGMDMDADISVKRRDIDRSAHACFVDSEYLTMCRPWCASSKKSHLVDQKQNTLEQ